MGLLIFLLALAVFKNDVNIYCNACSLLPGGSPPCFSNTLDQNAKEGEKFKEIAYELSPGKMFRYSGLQSSNAFIRLGQSWQHKVGTESDTVICERNTNEDEYLREYETKLEWLSSQLRSVDYCDAETYQELDVEEVFVITKREVWNCRGKENTPTSSLNFLRIVTELLGRSNVKSLSFYDGFEVVFVPDSSMPQAENKGELIPIVREIKYINSTNHKVLKYDGFLEFHQSKDDKGKGNSYFKEIIRNSRTQLGDAFKEVSKLEHEPSNLHTPSERIEKYCYEFIEIGPPPEKTIGTSDEVAICKRSENDPNLYAETYYTKWWRTVMRNSKAVDKKDLVFSLKFVITKHELWTCQTKGSREKFVRSIMEYIGIEPFELVYYSNAINLWKFVFDMVTQTQSIAVRDIAYFNENSKRVSYVGWIKEEEHFVNKVHLSKLLPSSPREISVPERKIVDTTD